MRNIFLLLLLLCFQASAQTKQVTGYYVSVTGDTVRGKFTNYTQWRMSPTKVEFMPDSGTEMIVLTPQNTTWFEITGHDQYLAFTGQRLLNPVNNEQVFANMPDASDQHAAVSGFLRVVAHAYEYTLYLYSDQIRSNFFIGEKGHPLQELRFKMFLKDNNIREMNEYRQQLHVLLRNRITTRHLSSLEKLRYTESDLIAFFDALQPTGKRPKKGSPISGLWIGAGVSYNSLAVTGEKTAFAARQVYGASFSPLLSIAYMVPVSRNFNKYYFQPYVRLYRYKNSGEMEYYGVKYTTTYQSSMVLSGGVNFGIFYVNQDDYKLFVSVGAGMMYLSDNHEITEATRSQPPGDTTYTYSDFDVTTLTYQGNINTGLLFRQKFMAWISYNLPSPIANFVYYTPQHTAIQVGVSIKL